MPDVLTLAAKLRAALEARDAAAIQRIVSAYQNIYSRLQGDIDALVLAIDDLEGPTRGQVQRLGQYSRLQDDLAAEMGEYQGYLKIEMSQAAEEALAMGSKDAKLLVAEMHGSGGVAAGFRTLNPETIKQILGYFDPAGPLMERLSQYKDLSVERVAQAILEGVGLGQGPKVIAKNITRALGMSLTDAMRMTRTVQIYSYREATRANYIANSDVVKGWIWNSALIPGRTCMSCVKMHGTEHPLSEPLNDHYNGLCTMLPLTIGSANPVKEGGEEWFKQQPEGVQRKMMGDAKFEAWKDGRININSMVGITKSDEYGWMISEQSYKNIVPPDETLDPFNIEPLNEVTDRDKYNSLVYDFENNGWRGNPILVEDIGDGVYSAHTGSHRVLAAREAGIDVPSVIIKQKPSGTDYLWDEMRSSRDDDNRMDIIKKLFDKGEVSQKAFDLIRIEVDNNYVLDSSAYLSKAKAYLLKQSLAKKGINNITTIVDTTKTLDTKALEKYNAAKKFLEDKYGDALWAEMTDNEMTLLEKLEKLAYSK